MSLQTFLGIRLIMETVILPRIVRITKTESNVNVKNSSLVDVSLSFHLHYNVKNDFKTFDIAKRVNRLSWRAVTL